MYYFDCREKLDKEKEFEVVGDLSQLQPKEESNGTANKNGESSRGH